MLFKLCSRAPRMVMARASRPGLLFMTDIQVSGAASRAEPAGHGFQGPGATFGT
jgi:hypothetical protein